MALLVEDLLVLARLDAHRPLNSEPVDVLSLAADAVQSARVAAPERSIRLEIGESDEPPMVMGDSPRLMQVMDHINAVWGRGTLRSAAEGVRKEWSMKREKKSPNYTTRWDELPEAR